MLLIMKHIILVEKYQQVKNRLSNGIETERRTDTDREEERTSASINNNTGSGDSNGSWKVYDSVLFIYFAVA